MLQKSCAASRECTRGHRLPRTRALYLWRIRWATLCVSYTLKIPRDKGRAGLGPDTHRPSPFLRTPRSTSARGSCPSRGLGSTRGARQNRIVQLPEASFPSPKTQNQHTKRGPCGKYCVLPGHLTQFLFLRFFLRFWHCFPPPNSILGPAPDGTTPAPNRLLRRVAAACETTRRNDLKR